VGCVACSDEGNPLLASSQCRELGDIPQGLTTAVAGAIYSADIRMPKIAKRNNECHERSVIL